jgi:monovalent cation:H+ antiporter-2, CPA2 family
LLNPVLASMVLSMLATPFIILHSNRIVMKLVSSDWLHAVAANDQHRQESHCHRQATSSSAATAAAARTWRACWTTRTSPTLRWTWTRTACARPQRRADSVVFGDAVRLQSLMAAGLARASAVVVTYHDTPSALKMLSNVRAHAPKVPVIVRTVDDPTWEAASSRRHRGGARGH